MPSRETNDPFWKAPSQGDLSPGDAPTIPPQGPLPDRLLDRAPPALAVRYDILQELGRGGMGVVYQARDRETGDIVAIKVLRPEIAERADLIERFKAELLLARKITHKNVCRTHELLRFGDTVAIAMEYVEGESLRRVLNRSQGVSLRYARDLARQVMAGLAEAHAQGVVHRDLKPENIQIARDGTVKVMDFGIARSIESGSTEIGTVMGTPAYMSPEQARGKHADLRSDIYSLGLILYEMFTGAAAFRAESSIAMVRMQVEESPPPPRTVEPSLPASLDRAVEKCLEKNPAKRFQSVAELEAALTERGIAHPAAGADEAVAMPLHLTRWQRSDWLLVCLGIIGLALFFPFFNRTSLAPVSKVSFDRGGLRHIAEDYAKRLGAPVGSQIEMFGEASGNYYNYLAEKAGPRVARESADNPVHYRVWHIAWKFEDRGDTTIHIDNRGLLTTFSRDFSAGSGPEALPPEEAMPPAEKALADIYNQDPAQLRLETASSDAWQGRPATRFVWVDPKDFHGLTLRYTVRMVGREIANLSASYSTPPGYVAPREWGNWGTGISVLEGLILIAFGFAQRRRVDLRARWRIVYTVVGVLAYEMLQVATRPAAAGPLFPNAILPLSASATALCAQFFLGSAALEWAVRRAALARWVNFISLFGRRAFIEPCGLAILRGAVLGLALLGLDTFLVWLGTTNLPARLDISQHIENPAEIILGRTPEAVVLMYSLFQTTVIISTPLAFVASMGIRLLRRPILVLLVTVAVVVPAWISTDLAAIQPPLWTLLLLGCESLLLFWVFTRFDLLTLMWTVFTFTFWWEEYRLLVMFEPTGAAGPWVALILWSLVVVGAAGIAFQASLRKAYRRLTPAFE
ncbi:MAG: serine/threonine protein kinase [Acidobacteria bacterium]|nr:serine/threonine protein kinase [Acidobacteriota bacterium]